MEEIDESLYSRQEIMLGKEAMQKMAKSSVFLSGLGGVGLEIAKNVALAGVKILTLHDTKQLSWTDLSSQFYASEADIGKNRAEISFNHVKELNPYTKVDVSQVDLESSDLHFLEAYQCVVITDAPLSLQIKINEFCHALNKPFIIGDVRGVFSWVFCDFGSAFEVMDKNGEEPKETLVGHITQEKEGKVTTLEHFFHGLEDGDYVTFYEVHGMTELNETVHKIKVISPSEFTIGDTSTFSTFISGHGIVRQVKVPEKMSFKTLKESLSDPSISIADFGKMDNPPQIHVGMQALSSFFEKHKRLPGVWEKKDGEEFLQLAKQINEASPNKVELKEDFLVKLAYTSQGSIVGLTSFVGGVVAQEVLKALSGKYTPLNNWLYLDAVEILDENDSHQPENKRYDGQLICIGKSLTEKILNCKLFMIGCGAIGCEMMKNYAMMGLSGGPSGKITVTDNDLIEKSNLNRQFLFRSKDLQYPKSETAAKSAKSMNPNLKITAYLDKVGQDTEEKYSDQFFQEQDIICNALDNVTARLYVDARCVTNKKPLLESGTLGPKGHVQVIIPYLTECYGSQRDPPEKDVPFCTLKSFPSQIEHCIEWARDFSFGGLFVSKPMQWNQIVEENDVVERLKKGTSGQLDLKVVRTALKLIRIRPSNFEDCVHFARKRFQAYYVNKALQLLHNFPLDHKIDDKGTLFWSSPKRPPKAIYFDVNDPTHISFVKSLAALWAFVWNIQPNLDDTFIQKVASTTPIEPFVPKQKHIETDESKKKEDIQSAIQKEDQNIEDQCKELAHYFEKFPPGKIFKLRPIDFEKDDDSNHHIDFIAATANLRARMYSIPEVERLKIKAIAGRIMPAIATTTASVSGLVSIEIIKLIKGCKLEEFKNLFMNLAIPFWGLAEPGVVEQKKLGSSVSYTLWDRWDVKLGETATLKQFVDYFQKEKNLEVSGVFKGAIMIYVPMFPGHKKRLTSKMSDLLKRKSEAYIDLIVTFNINNEDVSGPVVRFFFSK